MSDNASRDQNSVPTLLAVSSADGVSPVKLYADPTTHRLLTTPALTTARSTAQTAAVTSVVTTTVGSADSSYLILVNVDCTAYTSGSFSVQVAYTNESSTSVTANIQGHFTSGYGTTISGVGSFEGQALYIRALAGSTITISTTGTFTNLTYNVEGTIMKIT